MRKAVLVAVDDYPAPYTLSGSVESMNDFSYWVQMSGFSITTLTNANATKANILSNLTALVQGAQPGESLCFGFWGHGGQIPSQEDDGYSEGLCAYDAFSGGVVWDYEVDSILSGLPANVNVDLVFGCCFSGGIVEVPGVNVVSWQACRETEYAARIQFADGSVRSLFSLLLCMALQMEPLATRNDLFNYAAYWTTYYVPNQHPVLRCTQSERYQLMFM